MLNSLKYCLADFVKNPMDVSFMGKDNGEDILLMMRRDIVTNVAWIIIAVGLFALPAVLDSVLLAGGINTSNALPGGYKQAFTTLWYLFVFAYIFECYLSWYFNVYIVTNKRVMDMDFESLLSRKVTEAPITSIEDVTYSVGGIMANVFDYGNVNIQTAGEKQQLEFTSVPRTAYVHDVISDLATAAKEVHD